MGHNLRGEHHADGVPVRLGPGNLFKSFQPSGTTDVFNHKLGIRPVILGRFDKQPGRGIG